ncbi:uncharacterized protein DS421_2g45830 [Arachis hypogaea]|nr:uncharacterized protein DS421_2g45830 [Arachis hypogaea]
MTDDTKSGMAKMPLGDTLPRVQRMLLSLDTFIRDDEKEVLNHHSKFITKDKELKRSAAQIQSLNASLASLQEENTTLQRKIKSLEEAKKTFETKLENLNKQVAELMKEVESLNKSVKYAEQDVVDELFDADHNIQEQIKVLAPDLDTSSISAFKKVIDGKMIEIL